MLPEEKTMNVDEAMKSSANAEIGIVGGTQKQPSDKMDEFYEMIKENNRLEKENNALLKSIKENMNITEENSNSVVDEVVSQLEKTDIIDTNPVTPEIPGISLNENIDTINTAEKNDILESVNSDTNTFSPVNVDSILAGEPEQVEKIDIVPPIEEQNDKILSMNDILASENKVEEALLEEEKITPIPLEEPIIPITPVETPSVSEEVKSVIDEPKVLPIENDLPKIEEQKEVKPVEEMVKQEQNITPEPSKSFTDVSQLYVGLSEVKIGENQQQRLLPVDNNDSLKIVNQLEKTLVMNQ